jgi:hypothetical protein
MKGTQQELINGRIVHPGYPADPALMKTHHELDCPVLPKIQEEVLTWIDEKTDYLRNPVDVSFWHLIDYVDLAKSCPTLLSYLVSIKCPPRELTVGVLTDSMKDSGFALHMGHAPQNIKINFPILNTEDVYTEWYDIPEEDMIKLGTHLYRDKDFLAFQYKLGTIHDTVQDLYPCLTRYNMHKNPIVFNSWMPHRVMAGPSAKYPRIMVATMPIKEPTHYLLK